MRARVGEGETISGSELKALKTRKQGNNASNLSRLMRAPSRAGETTLLLGFLFSFSK